MEVAELELVWAAGFFDGEGCITTRSAKNWWYTHLGVTQKDQRPLQRFNSAIGGIGRYYGAKTRDTKDLVVYKQEQVIDVLNMLWPYLSEPKKEQAIRALNKKENKGEV